MTHKRLIELAINKGATKATLLATEDIVFDLVFRSICESNGCGMSGRCWMCPPDIGPAEDLINMVRSYKNALIFQTITGLEESFDFEIMKEAGSNLARLCHNLKSEAKKIIGDDILVLGAGGCRMCERCARLDNLPCYRPNDALISLEACCIDVSNTVKNTQLKYINGADTVTYFGMVLFN